MRPAGHAAHAGAGTPRPRRRVSSEGPPTWEARAESCMHGVSSGGLSDRPTVPSFQGAVRKVKRPAPGHPLSS